MSEWYYADARRERHGPVDAGVIRDKFRSGELDLSTLVWCEGMMEWKPLSAMADELQLLVQANTGIDLRADYTAIENGTATYTPYAASAATLEERSSAVQGGEIVHAGLWRRFAASCIDSIVTAVASYALLIPLFLVFGLSMSALAQSELAGAGVSIGFMVTQYSISILVPALYFGWMQSSSSMASLGKMAVGIKVVRGNGERLSFWRSFLRYIALILFTLVTCGLGMFIAGLMVAFTERKQGAHDMICDTLVVDKWAFTHHPEWQQRGLGTVTIVVLAIVGLLMLVGIIGIVALFGIIASHGR